MIRFFQFLNHNERSMKAYVWSALTTLLFSVSGGAQESTEVIKLVGDGILYYQEGMYDDARNLYEQALVEDPKSSLALYEMALLYYDQKQYDKAIEYAELALKYDKSSQKQALLLKGSALDNMGESKEALKIYKKAVKRYGDDHLVHYNIGLTYWRAGDVERAEDHLHEAVMIKSDHLNSHYLICYIQQNQGRVLEGLLSGLFYLSLAPDSPLAEELLEELHQSYFKQVERGEGNVINISLNEWEGAGALASMKLMIPLLAASKTSMEEEAGAKMTKGESFVFMTKGFLESLPREAYFDGTIWTEIYLPYFQRLQYHGLIEPFTYYAAMSKPGWSEKWLEEHSPEMDQFYSRMEEFKEEQKN